MNISIRRDPRCGICYSTDRREHGREDVLVHLPPADGIIHRIALCPEAHQTRLNVSAGAARSKNSKQLYMHATFFPQQASDFVRSLIS